ncbi:MAG: PAS domain S-box protein, partial [Clostridia bacterium]
MQEDFYKQIMEESSVGYAYHKIICDVGGNPCDYTFLEANDAFTKLTGLDKLEIIGKRVTEVLPDIKTSKFDWIKIYGDIALHNGKAEFEEYAEQLAKWYKIIVYAPEKNYFITSFTDITKEKKQIEALEQISKSATEFLQLANKAIDYQKITDDFLALTGAKYAVFNLFDKEGVSFTTKALAGDLKLIKKATALFGYEIAGKKWEQDLVRMEKIEKNTINKFSSVQELAGKRIEKALLAGLEKVFNIGEVVVVKILSNEIMLGDFTAIMAKGEKFNQEIVAELYTKQLGIMLKQKRIEADLSASEEQYKCLFDYSGLAIGFYKPDGEVISYNKKAAANMGGKPEDYIGKSIYELFPRSDADFYMGRINIALASDGQQEYEDYVALLPGEKWFLSTFNRIIGSNGEILGVQIISQDITEKKETVNSLKETQDYLEKLIGYANAPIIVWDRELHITKFNHAFELITGRKNTDVLGASLDILFPKVQVQRSMEIVQALQQGERLVTEEIEIQNLDGTIKTLLWNSANIYKEDGKSYLATIAQGHDITERKKSEAEILYLGYHDQLTGLYNRRFFEEELKRIDTIRNLPITLVMADVNSLKLINDSFGHNIGDDLLKKVAEVILQGCRADDIIARLGGDEFVILLPKTNAVEAEDIINRISGLAAVEKIGSINISIAFGFDSKKQMDISLQDVLKQAEDYMYKDKLYNRLSIRSKTIDIIATALFEKSKREALHSKRVSEICEAIAIEMKMDKYQINQLKTAGLLHDIGKIGIDEKILNKAGSLNAEEWEVIKGHPETGWRILSSASEFTELAGFVLEHHERWDGTGYPKGLHGVEISLPARIIAIADAYEAMTGKRSYRESLGEKA